MHFLFSFLVLFFIPLTLHSSPEWLAIKAPTKELRTKLANLGVSLESLVEDTVYAVVEKDFVKEIERAGFKISSRMEISSFQRLDFPQKDSKYHDYMELKRALAKLAETYPSLITVFSIGKTVEGRDIWALRFNPDNLSPKEVSGRPGIVFMGGHHSREHLSVEIPLKLAQYLASSYSNNSLTAQVLSTREIFIIPAVNPDGLEYDISKNEYLYWRKNRNINPNSSCIGVDLNRNYAYKWASIGSSSKPCSDLYHGTAPFSELESQAIKKFLEKYININILLTFHSYSELILYPWGHKYSSIENKKDLATYKEMAQTMATWNKYTPMQSSSLYATSGDTTDWSYGVLGIISFTFELSPSRFSFGGFYPGDEIIESTFNSNLRPMLYLIDLADDPYRALKAPETTLFYGDRHSLFLR